MKALIALVAAFALAPVAASGARPATAKETLTTLDQQVPGWMQQARIPAVAIAVIRDGALAGTRVYGERAPGVPADERTVFNVASLTKPAFSMMAMKLVADGQLDLDAPLHEHWTDPDVADDERHLQLTPRLVMSHQTGLQNWRGSDRLAFSFAPGDRHEYSGEGFEYLRRALENRTMLSTPELMREHLLKPAGIEASFGWSGEIADNLATGFDEAGEPLDMQYLRQRKASAAASMFTTARDYGRFIAWVGNGGALPAATFAEIQRPQAQHDNPSEAFGLGWKLVRENGGTTALWHDGREPGVRSLALVRPGERDGVVVLTNSSNGELIMRRVLEASLPQGEAVTRQMDRDVWRYLQSLRGQQLGQLLGAIVRSPAYMSMMMHAVDTNLLQASGLEPEHRRAASRAIGKFALGMLHGRIDTSQAEALLSVALRIEQNTPSLRSELSVDQAQAWTNLLLSSASSRAAPKRSDADAERPPTASVRSTVDVPMDILQRYVGNYLVPSSQLPIAITVDGGVLTASAPDTPTIAFHAASETLFFMTESATDFEFQLDERGTVTGIRIIWDGNRSEFAPRVR